MATTTREAIRTYRIHLESVGAACDRPEDQMIDRGSYFFFADPETWIGRNGVFVDKASGRLFVVGSFLNREAAFWAFEHGLFIGDCNLVVTRLHCSPGRVIDIFTDTPPSQCGMDLPGREPWFELLADLPAVVVPRRTLMNYTYDLMDAERDGTFEFEIRVG